MLRLRSASCLVLTISACAGPAEPGDSEGATSSGPGASTGPGTTAEEPTTTTPTTTPTTEATTDPPVEGLRPNWHEDIAPLVAMHCASCHTPGGLSLIHI